MRAWTQTKAQRVSKLINNALLVLGEYNRENERLTHEFKGQDLTQHTEAMNTERILWGTKGTFDRFTETVKRRRGRE